MLSGAAASSAQAALSSRGTPSASSGGVAGTSVTSGLMALQQLEDLASDGIITPAEKLQLNQDWVIIVAEGNPSTGVLVLQAAKYGLSATAFNAAYANLAGYVTSSGIFTDMSSNTVLDRTVWDGYVEAYMAARTALAKIGAKLGENLIDSTGTILLSNTDLMNAYIGASPSRLQAGYSATGMTTTSCPVKAAAVTLYNPNTVTNITILNASAALTVGNYGAGGLDSAFPGWQEDILYSIHFIYNPTTSTLALLASTSVTNPTLPSGYTYFRCVSAVLTDNSTQFIPYYQLGPSWSLVTPWLLASVKSTNWQGVGLPWMAGQVGTVNLYVSYSVNGYAVYISLDANSTWWAADGTSNVLASGIVPVPGDCGIDYKTGSASAGTLGIYLEGLELLI